MTRRCSRARSSASRRVARRGHSPGTRNVAAGTRATLCLVTQLGLLPARTGVLRVGVPRSMASWISPPAPRAGRTVSLRASHGLDCPPACPTYPHPPTHPPAGVQAQVPAALPGAPAAPGRQQDAAFGADRLPAGRQASRQAGHLAGSFLGPLQKRLGAWESLAHATSPAESLAVGPVALPSQVCMPALAQP